MARNVVSKCGSNNHVKKLQVYSMTKTESNVQGCIQKFPN